MPVHKCADGSYRIGSGPCMYETKESAQAAYVAYLAQAEKGCGGFLTTAVEHPIEAALVSVNGRVSFGGTDIAAMAAVAPGDPVAGPVVMLVGQAAGVTAKARVGNLDALREEARLLAAAQGMPVALAVTVKAGERDTDSISVLAARYYYEPHNRETLVDAAHEAFPEALRQLSMLDTVRKELDPLDPRYFDRVAAMLSTYMANDFSRVSAPVFDKWINGLLSANWADATDAELMLVTQQLNASMREIGGKHWLGIRGQIYHKTETLGHAVKRATVKRYDLAISPNLSLKDVGAIRQVTASQANYVTNKMGEIAVGASQQANQIVRNGLAKGLGSKEIGADLYKALGKTLKDRTRHYFDTAALAILNRSQSYSKAVTYSEAGVERARWDSVLDEITSATCRFCHGKTFSVKAILGGYSKTAALSDPKDVKFTQPFMRERKIKGGEHAGLTGLFIRQKDGTDSLVAAEIESGMGIADKRGKWHPAMDIETLEDMGFSAPPGHFGCRSTLAPDVIPPKTRTRRANVPAPRAKTPTVDPMGAKGPVSSVTANRALTYYDGLRMAQARKAVDAGRKPRAVSKYDRVIDFCESQAIPPVFSAPSGLALEAEGELAVERIRAILLAADPQAVARLREIRLSGKIAAKDALSKVSYKEADGVLTISRAAAKDPTDAGKYATGKQLTYALKLEKKRAGKKPRKLTPKDRAAARTADLSTESGKLFDEKALEEVP